MTFIVRISRDEAGQLTGIVLERVKTGHKERVQRIEDISRLIARIFVAEPYDALGRGDETPADRQASSRGGLAS